jgi:hemerythrin HHE cation binding domain-containing protein
MNQNAPLLAHDHDELDQLLNGFFSALSAGDINQSYAMLDRFWARLAMHIRAEHLHLFPSLLRALENPGQTKRAGEGPSLEKARSTISRLQEDHDYFMRELAAAVKQAGQLRTSTEAVASAELSKVREQVMGVSQRLESHNQLEESQAYQWSELLLEPAERAALNERMQKELGNLPPRFRGPESSRSSL